MIRALPDPALGLTPGLLEAVNRARAAGACATAASAALRAPCPPLPPVQGLAIADLALADAHAAMAYADCAARHAGAVNAYQAAREAAMLWNEDE